MKRRRMSGNDLKLGRDANSLAVPEVRIQGRWLVEGANVDEALIDDKHW